MSEQGFNPYQYDTAHMCRHGNNTISCGECTKGENTSFTRIRQARERIINEIDLGDTVITLAELDEIVARAKRTEENPDPKDNSLLGPMAIYLDFFDVIETLKKARENDNLVKEKEAIIYLKDKRNVIL